MKLSRDLNDLTEKVHAAALVITQMHPEVFITETGRSEEQQRENIKKGVSWTMESMHMMKPKSRAFDIAFYGDELYPNDIKKWEDVAKTAKDMGMNWGYAMWGTDKPHFECDGTNTNLDTMDTPMKKQMELEVPTELQIFNNYDDISALTVGEAKALINIGIFRFHKAEAMKEFKKFNNQ